MVAYTLDLTDEPSKSLGEVTKQTFQAIEIFVKDYLRTLQSKKVDKSKSSSGDKLASLTDGIVHVDEAIRQLEAHVASLPSLAEREQFYEELKPSFTKCVIAFDRMNESFESLERTFNSLSREGRRIKEARFRTLERGYRKGLDFQDRVLSLMDVLDPMPDRYFENEINKRYGNSAPEIEAAFFRIATAPGFSAEEFKDQFKKNNIR